MSQTLIDMYREMSDIAHAICATCDPPHHCCELAGCDQARFWAKWMYDVDLQETNGPLPFLTHTGCTVAPHHRPICAMFFCHAREKDLPPRFFELRQKIVSLEAERFK